MSANLLFNEIIESLDFAPMPLGDAEMAPCQMPDADLSMDAPCSSVMPVPGRKCPNCLAKGNTVWTTGLLGENVLEVWDRQ
ncbi:hypothetical protein K402DRAFT_418536 [Aulographum hederae CBS 113979]|uniref:Uncharacterized protein n=1 Tax=Aulographum hederae CBS 113979 TaxID=1176131 RepID=A0A6G1H9F0_9PEZI|nr:hypothetical protein K402DRAFT_418536 [Aulographum hederae CBS 113979]